MTEPGRCRSMFQAFIWPWRALWNPQALLDKSLSEPSTYGTIDPRYKLVVRILALWMLLWTTFLPAAASVAVLRGGNPEDGVSLFACTGAAFVIFGILSFVGFVVHSALLSIISKGVYFLVYRQWPPEAQQGRTSDDPGNDRARRS